MTFFDYPTEHPAGAAAAADSSAGSNAPYLLPGADERDWSDLLQVTTARHLGDGETLIEPGAADRSLYLVVEGRLEVLEPASRRRWRVVAVVGAGNVIGELSFFDGDGRSALVRAVGEAAVAELSPESLALLGRTRPDLALSVAMDLGRILAQRLRRLQSTPVVAG